MSLSWKDEQPSTPRTSFDVYGSDLKLESNPVNYVPPTAKQTVEEPETKKERNMPTERQRLQIELERTLNLLDKQKTRRMVIMSLIHAVVTYIVLAFINGSLPNELRSILINAFVSLILGFISFIFYTSCFSMVTDLFTEIYDLEDRAKILSDRIKTLK